MTEPSFHTRPMTAAEVALAVEWAAAEGWNPGPHDAGCFRAVDPKGFILGLVDGEPAASISVVNYDDAFAFLGFYIVRPEFRGRGFGWRTWQAGIAHAGGRTIGLDGVVAQQDNYRRSGFTLAYRNIRYCSQTQAAVAYPDGVVPLPSLPFEAVAAYDRGMFPAGRDAFLRRWISAPGHSALALMREGKLAGYGVLRRCRTGCKIGPLFADDPAAADTLFAALAGGREGPVFFDVPEVNAMAVALAKNHGSTPVFETARMYTGPAPRVDLDRIFGVTSFELG